MCYLARCPSWAINGNSIKEKGMSEWFDRLNECLDMTCKDIGCEGVGSIGCEEVCRLIKMRIHSQRWPTKNPVQTQELINQ